MKIEIIAPPPAEGGEVAAALLVRGEFFFVGCRMPIAKHCVPIH